MVTPITFFQQTRDELRKVTWPTRQEIIRLTGIVILISLIVGLFVGGLDFIFTRILEVFVR